MWEPRRLTTLCASTTCYRNSFTFYMWSPCCLCVCVSHINFFVMYTVHVVSKESRRLVLFRTFCFMKGIYMPEFSNSHFFSGYSPLVLIHFFIVLESYWYQQHKRFYPECVASSGHRIWIHHQFLDFSPPRCTFICPSEWKSLGAKSGL
jgi:hypothetical protein